MKYNLLKIFDEEVKPELFEELKRIHLGDDRMMYRHLSLIHASVIGGLLQKSKNENGPSVMKNLIEKGSHDGDILYRIRDVFENEQSIADHKKLGNSLLAFVFETGTDQAFEKIQHFLSDRFEIPEVELIEVNKMIAPFSMGILGEIVHGEDMDPEAIAKLLESNAPLIVEKYGALADVLGIETQEEELIEEDSIPSEVKESADIETRDIVPPLEPKSTETKAKVKVNTGDEVIDKKAFFRHLYPWVALLIISGLALFLLKKFDTKSVSAKEENPFTFIQSDSLRFQKYSRENTYTLPGNVLIRVENNSYLDILLSKLNESDGRIERIQFANRDITFEDSSAVLTPAASEQLDKIMTIMKSYDQLKLDITLNPDIAFATRHPELLSRQVRNLRNYFDVFGLRADRLKVDAIRPPPPPQDNPDSEIVQDSLQTETSVADTTQEVSAETNQEWKIQLVFYTVTPATE